MADMRLVVSHKGVSKQVSLSAEQASHLRGRKIGDHFKGEPYGLPGYVLEIRGGTDKDGFPMRNDLGGTARKKVILSKGPGYRPKEKGVRRRKMIRGHTVGEDIAQLNTVVIKEGKKPLDKLLGAKEDSEKKES